MNKAVVLLLTITITRFALGLPEPEAAAIPLRVIILWVGFITGGIL